MNEIIKLRESLNLLLADEDLTDEKLREASEGLLPQIADYLNGNGAFVDGASIILKERIRQIEVEGWTPEHDSNHTEGELANAACVYAMTDEMMDFLDYNWGDDNYLHFWPFELESLKKNRNGTIYERVKDLSKAGAMIAAEIDRLLT